MSRMDVLWYPFSAKSRRAMAIICSCFSLYLTVSAIMVTKLNKRLINTSIRRFIVACYFFVFILTDCLLVFYLLSSISKTDYRAVMVRTKRGCLILIEAAFFV